MTANPFNRESRDSTEPLADGATWMLDLVAAVDYLRRGHRPGFTVWDALEEALRWGNDHEPSWDAVDPLAGTLHRLLDDTTTPVAAVMQGAVRRWVLTMADRYNSGHHWPHPQPRRGFPPPTLDTTHEDVVAW